MPELYIEKFRNEWESQVETFAKSNKSISVTI